MKNFAEESLLQWQQDQYQHDRRNHADILFLHRNDRLKHYGLHFAKYVGRIALEDQASIPFERTIVDTCLVSLSAANTMSQRLHLPSAEKEDLYKQMGTFRVMADASGRFADACEKIDHMEAFIEIANKSNQDIFEWVYFTCKDMDFDVYTGMVKRRKELRKRAFYIREDT